MSFQYYPGISVSLKRPEVQWIVLVNAFVIDNDDAFVGVIVIATQGSGGLLWSPN